jgi:hypothetical protein
LFKRTKSAAEVALFLLLSMFALATVTPYVANVNAQSTATVDVLISVGGTTDPATGTYTFNDGTAVTLTATEGNGFVFSFWVIASNAGTIQSTDNPYTLNVVGGDSYGVQAVFQPVQVPPSGTPITNITAAAIVNILAAAGGTTTPPPGTYALENATNLMITATPDSGWQFLHWVISGYPIEGAHGAFPFDPTPTDNPYNVNHGYGNTYNYQPVFVPVGASPPAGTTPTPTSGGGGLSGDTITIIVVAVVVIIIIIVAVGAYTYSRRSKK